MARVDERRRTSRADREWQIESAVLARSARRARRDAQGRQTLADDLQIGRLLSSHELRELVRLEYAQPVISVYLNLAGDRSVRRPPIYLTVLNSLGHTEKARRQDIISALTTHQRQGLDADLDEVLQFAADLDPQGARSLVLFKCGKQLNRAVLLPTRVRDSVTIEADPYVVPLEAILEENPPVILAEVRVEASRVWAYRLGRVEELDRVHEYIPTGRLDNRRPLKEEGGRETHLVWHLKATAQVVSRLLAELRAAFVVLAGDEAVMAEFERYLPEAMRDKVEARLRPAPNQTAGDWDREVGEVVREHRARQEAELATHLGDFIGQGRLAAGLPQVIDAANQFFIGRLAVSTGLERPGFVCREHHFLSLEAGACPYDDAPLLAAENVIDELLEVARLHGVEVTIFEERPELLDRYEGVAALLYEAVAGSPDSSNSSR